MSLIKINQTVQYASFQSRGRTFTGRVHCVHGDRAVIRHDSDPRYVTVDVARLTVLDTSHARFAGYAL